MADGRDGAEEEQQDDGCGGEPVDTPLDVIGIACRTLVAGGGEPGPYESVRLDRASFAVDFVDGVRIRIQSGQSWVVGDRHGDFILAGDSADTW